MKLQNFWKKAKNDFWVESRGFPNSIYATSYLFYIFAKYKSLQHFWVLQHEKGVVVCEDCMHFFFDTCVKGAKIKNYRLLKKFTAVVHFWRDKNLFYQRRTHFSLFRPNRPKKSVFDDQWTIIERKRFHWKATKLPMNTLDFCGESAKNWALQINLFAFYHLWWNFDQLYLNRDDSKYERYFHCFPYHLWLDP